MNSDKSPLTLDTSEEISALIETLHRTEQRLETLTGGEVDTVADLDGRTLLLRRAQDHMRHNEAAKQAAILNALPAHIALLNAHGLILSVNEAWRRFDGGNVLQCPGHEIGFNYLTICDVAQENDTSGAREVAEGVRSVLSGKEKRFSIEYPCHSATQPLWLLLTVTPLAGNPPHGAIIMHLDVTAKRRTEESLHASELRFRQMAENIRDVFWLTDPAKNQMLYISPAYEEIWGRSCASICASPREWLDAIHPEDRERVLQAAQTRQANGKYVEEYRIVRPDGTIRWIRDRAFPVLRNAGEVYRIAGLAEDITERRRTESALRESEVQLKGILESTVDGILAVDSKGKVIRANGRFAELWRIPKPLLDTGDDQALLEFVGRQLKDAAAFVNKVQLLYASDVEDMDTLAFKDGRIFERASFPLILDGAILGRVWSFRDITERKEAEARIAYLNRVYAMLSGINTLIVRVHDRDELFREACRIAVDQGGFRMSLIGIVDRSTMKIVPIASAGKDEELLTAIKGILSSTESAPNTMVARAMREKKAVVSNDSQRDPAVLFGKHYAESGVRSMAIFPLIVADEAVGVVALYAGEFEFFHEEEMKLLTELTNDIAFAIDHIDKQERLDYLAYYDALTGLANQSLFLERLHEKLLSGRDGQCKIAVIVLDIERFKTINDAFGRQAGDALLKQIAERLVQIGGGDASRFARIGAGRFAITASGMNTVEQVGRYVEQRLNANFHGPFRVGDNELRVSVKAGIALFPDDGADGDTLLCHAEAALKKTKATDEHYLFFTQAMTERVAERLSLENRLRQALDNEEFVLHYQPKVNLVSGKLTSAEALIRWNDPRTGLVPPCQFIPILEETGLINEVGRWALRKAIEDYLRWCNAGLAAVRIAVNVSPLQLRNRGFIDEIRQTIAVDARAAAGLELEITESLIMADVKHSIASLQAIRTMGVSIAIDDFGTGFSSLSYLSRLPVDTLKIDRSFVIDMTGGPEGLALVSTIINLAHALKLKVVAEGVETEEQSRLLRLLDCDEMQGFLFSKAVPSEIFETRFLAPPPGG